MTILQENRLISIATPLGPDELILTGFSGTEGLSIPYRFELDLLSENTNISFEDIIGQNVTLSIVLANGGSRFFNGIISQFSHQGGGGGTNEESTDIARYSATMVPWFWLLTKTSSSRIFQNLTVPDIVEQIFKENSLNDFSLNLHESYEPKEYCVQYRETAFNFVSRLLEQEGIFFFFQHEEDKHTMVLADSPDEHQPCPNQETIRCQINEGQREEEDLITSLDKMQEIRIGKYTVKDFNYLMPSTDLKVEVDSQLPLGPGEREIYDFPAEYINRSGGEHLANIRMQKEEAQLTTIIGTSTCRALTSGYRFDLSDHSRQEMNGQSYVLHTVNHSATESAGGSGQTTTASYSNSFSCIPFDIPYRPPLDTPRPLLGGVQTAIVVGPAGEEIHTDEHARVKVQFHWDREGQNDDKSSCWIRVSQLWAGSGWGAMNIPRIGQEVIVDFIEGDPDRPIIIGRVYNANNTPPYSLPADKTKSTIKSESSLGGGGANEFRFEDKAGSEEIFLHGQKDWTIAIDNDKNQTVGHDESLDVGNNRSKSVGTDQSENIGSNKSISVGENHSESIGADASITIGGDETVTIGNDLTLSVGNNSSSTIGKEMSLQVGKNSSVMVGTDSTVDIGKNSGAMVGDNMDLSVGKQLNIQAKDEINIISDKQITLKTGKASITLKKSGDIIIKGGKINVKGSGDVTIKGSKIKEN